MVDLKHRTIVLAMLLVTEAILVLAILPPRVVIPGPHVIPLHLDNKFLGRKVNLLDVTTKKIKEAVAQKSQQMFT